MSNTVRLRGAPREDSLPSEIAEALEAVEELAGRRRARRRGAESWLQSPAARRAIEAHAMDSAIGYFEADGWDVRNVGAQTYYDLDCLRGDEELHVEVKGRPPPAPRCS